LSKDWRILTRKRRQRQRAIIARISKRSPTDQSGHEILANKNEQYWSGTRLDDPLLLLSFLNEQYLFNNDTSGSAIPNAISWIAFLSS